MDFVFYIKILDNSSESTVIYIGLTRVLGCMLPELTRNPGQEQRHSCALVQLRRYFRFETRLDQLSTIFEYGVHNEHHIHAS